MTTDHTHADGKKHTHTASAAKGTRYEGSMSGLQVVPGAGDPDGTGAHVVAIDPAAKTLCYELTWKSLDKPDAAHIHVGAKDQGGRVMVDLKLPDGGPKGCVAVDEASVGGAWTHYVDLHSPAFAEGAIRGQLQG